MLNNFRFFLVRLINILYKIKNKMYDFSVYVTVPINRILYIHTDTKKIANLKFIKYIL